MTRDELLNDPDFQQVIRQVRLRVIRITEQPNTLGYGGVVFGMQHQDALITDPDGNPLTALAVLLSFN